jgi:hypothetical protein
MGKDLFKAENNNGTMTGTTTDLDNNLIAGLAQGWSDPDLLFMLQGGDIYISEDRGITFSSAVSTPFTSLNPSNKSIGSGVVLPTNDNWILFCGPSLNNVGSILSEDGGITWNDVTGDFPAGEFSQTGDMVATPNGQFIFAGTDIGPYVFVVSELTWYPIGGVNAPLFNGMDVDYIESIQTVRFASWGSGIWDFNITNLEFANIENNRQKEEIIIYTTANETTFSILESGTYNFKIYSLNGTVIFEQKLDLDKGINSVQHNLNSIAKQVGILKIEGENTRLIKKVVI